jgi:hypothetical protein
MKQLHNHFNLVLLLLLVTMGFISLSSGEADPKDQGSQLGDIKYSILPPEVFSKYNTGTWVPLDGMSVNASWELSKLSDAHQLDPILFQAAEDGQLHLPDVRGTFLRSMNHHGGYDPDTLRTVGSLQTYGTKPPQVPFHGNTNLGELHVFDGTNTYHLSTSSFGSHSVSLRTANGISKYGAKKHGIPALALYGVNSTKNFKKFRRNIQLEPLNKRMNANKNGQVTIDAGSGDVETRPVNVAFYTYIRVN